MKCVNCGTDNKLRDRKESNGRCKQCHHQFTFEPTDMGAFKITDAMFSKTLADISVNYTLQVYIFIEVRELMRPKHSPMQLMKF